MTSTALVLWEPVVRFNERWDEPPYYPEVRYRPPKNTLDPRYRACRRHRVACDCREAEFAENRGELQYTADENRRMEQGIDAVLLLHVEGKAPGWRKGRCVTCEDIYPCATRRILAPLSWRAQHEGI